MKDRFWGCNKILKKAPNLLITDKNILIDAKIIEKVLQNTAMRIADTTSIAIINFNIFVQVYVDLTE